MQFLILLTLVFAQEPSTSNTNKVLSLLPALAESCPRHLSKCCTAIAEFSSAGGFCNPISKALLQSKYGILKKVIKNGCKLIKPHRFHHASCKNFKSHTYNNGTCSLSDIELETARVLGSISWARSVLAIGNAPGCFNFTSFENILASGMVAEPEVRVSHGLGNYKGLSLVAEYMSVLSPKVNRGFMSMIEVPGSHPKVKATKEGIIIAAVVNISNIDDKYHFETPGNDNLEALFEFEGCDVKISAVDFPGRSRLDNSPTSTSQIASMGISNV